MTHFDYGYILYPIYAGAFLLALWFGRRKRRLAVFGGLGIFILSLPGIANDYDMHFFFWLGERTIKFPVILIAIIEKVPVYALIGTTLGLMLSALSYFHTQSKLIKSIITIIALGTGFVMTVCFEYSCMTAYKDVPQQCSNSDLHFSLGSMRMSLPANNTMLIYTGPKSTWTTYGSFLNWPMRELCRKAGDAQSPMPVAHIAFVTSLFDRAEKDQDLRFGNWLCSSTEDDGKKLLCEAASSREAAERRLTSMTFYLPQKFGSLVYRHGPWTDFLETAQTAAKVGRSWTGEPAGKFLAYPEDFYVSSDYNPQTGNPPSTVCSPSLPKGWLNCQTTAQFSGGLAGRTNFRTPTAELDKTTAAVNQAMKDFLALTAEPQH